MSVVLYVAFLFSANRFYAHCMEPLAREQFIKWLKIEEIIFYANMLGMIFFLLFKALMGRCRKRFQLQFESEKRHLSSSDILTRHRMDSLIL